MTAQITKIQTQKAARLAELNKQYAVQDTIKNTAGLIAIISIFTLFTVIISIDLFNLMVYLCGKEEGHLGKMSSNKDIKNKMKLYYTP